MWIVFSCEWTCTEDGLRERPETRWVARASLAAHRPRVTKPRHGPVPATAGTAAPAMTPTRHTESAGPSASSARLRSSPMAVLASPRRSGGVPPVFAEVAEGWAGRAERRRSGGAWRWCKHGVVSVAVGPLGAGGRPDGTAVGTAGLDGGAPTPSPAARASSSTAHTPKHWKALQATRTAAALQLIEAVGSPPTRCGLAALGDVAKAKVPGLPVLQKGTPRAMLAWLRSITTR